MEYQPSPAYSAPAREQPYAAPSAKDRDPAYADVPNVVTDRDEFDPYEFPDVVEPTPVVIVPRTERPFARHLFVNSYTVGSTPVQVIGNQYVDRNIKLVNTSADTIVIGTHSGVTAATGFPLAAGNDFESKTTDTIWAVASSGDLTLSVAEERTYET